MQSDTMVLHKMYKGAGFEKQAKYFQVYDLGVTFGTIYDNFNKWVRRDLPTCKFQSEFIRTEITSDKTFLWEKGLLGQARKPCLSLQCSIEHNYLSEVYSHPAWSSFDAVHFLEPKEFTYPLLSLEDDNDRKNSIQFRMAVKSIKLVLSAGIATNSRFEAENIASFWKTKRQNNLHYNFPMALDFRIPDEILEIVASKFDIDLSDWTTALKKLNKNSQVRINYAVDGFTGKSYYFFRYNVSPLIVSTDMTNPTEYETKGSLKGFSYSLIRQFELEVLVPSIISMTAYGDKLVLEDFGNPSPDGVGPDLKDANRAHLKMSERYIESDKVIKEKHAVLQISFRWTESDLHKLNSGDKVAKFDIKTLYASDRYITQITNWALSQKYKYADIFDFALYKLDKNLHEDSKRNEIIGETNEDTIVIPSNNDIYKYYVKDMSKMEILDLKPDVNQDLFGILYLNLEIRNRYEAEVGPRVEHSTGNDDLGIKAPTGPVKDDIGSKYF